MCDLGRLPKGGGTSRTDQGEPEPGGEGACGMKAKKPGMAWQVLSCGQFQKEGVWAAPRPAWEQREDKAETGQGA